MSFLFKIKFFGIFLLVILFQSKAFGAVSLETRLASEINDMKGIKMTQISFATESENITGATVNIRLEPGYRLRDEQKNAIISFILYSTINLSPKNITVNVSEEPIISFPTNSTAYGSLSLEQDLAIALKKTLPIEKAYVNLVVGKKNFMGELDIKSKAAVLIKIKNEYQLEEKEIFSIVDFLCKSVTGLTMDNIFITDDSGNTLFEIVK